MLVLHVAATLVAALVIVGADRALWWLAAWLRPLVGSAAPVVVVPRPVLPTPVEVPVVRRRLVARRRAAARSARLAVPRGPPALTG